MSNFSRYAIYYAPEAGPFADFGAAWLGWDASTGRPCPHPELAGLPRPVQELVERPRRYGLHATLKPPFRLAQHSSPEALAADIDRLAGRLAPASAPKLELAGIGRFLALTPAGDCPEIAALAAETVRALDPHRAAPSREEIERRRKSRLSPQQETYLARWGYPYVFDAFRFHITLTGPLSEAEITATRAALAPVLSAILPVPFRISSICLFGEAPDGFFHLVSRHPLKG